MNYTLTGKYRHRLHNPFFGSPKLVLEVEIKWDNGPGDSYGMPSYIAGSGWKDAEVHDLIELNIGGFNEQ